MAVFKSLFLPLALCAALPALAQSEEDVTITNGQKFGAWTVNCVAVAVGQTNCTLTQRILRASDNAFIADLVAVRDPDAQTYIVARVPVGVSLPAGFAMREAEAEEPMEFTWQVCTREVCEAVLKVEDDLVPVLSADDNAMIAAFKPSTQSDAFVFQFSLSGMQAGLDAISK